VEIYPIQLIGRAELALAKLDASWSVKPACEPACAFEEMIKISPFGEFEHTLARPLEATGVVGERGHSEWGQMYRARLTVLGVSEEDEALRYPDVVAGQPELLAEPWARVAELFEQDGKLGID
jgi:hypothetical protein